MVYQFESDIKVDDEILMAELGSNGSVALKNIVSTIQKEQNAIIRNTKDRIMVIQGQQDQVKHPLRFTGLLIFFIMTGRI